jgi:hypothetical protein
VEEVLRGWAVTWIGKHFKIGDRVVMLRDEPDDEEEPQKEYSEGDEAEILRTNVDDLRAAADAGDEAALMMLSEPCEVKVRICDTLNEMWVYEDDLRLKSIVERVADLDEP